MTIRWALIGTGRVHRWIAPAIKASKDSDVVAVMSRDQDRADAFASEFGIVQACDSLDELLGNPQVDVVYIGSPNGLHAEQTIRAAEAGKHVFCEKPMAPTPKACRAMIEACETHGVKLGIALQYRQHPGHHKMRDIIDSGELGQLVFTNAQVQIPPLWAPGWYYEPSLAGGGVLYMVGVHRIDLMRFLLRCEVEEVSAFVGEQPSDRPFEDMLVTMLRFENGVYGTMHFSLNIPHGNNNMEVHGDRGSLYGMDTTSLWWGGGGGEVLLKTEAETTRHEFNKTDVYKDEIEDFNQCIREDGQPLATAIDGLRAAEVSVAIYESGRQGKCIRVADMRD